MLIFRLRFISLFKELAGRNGFYADVISVLIISSETTHSSLYYIFAKQKNINFGVEHEQPGSLVFLNHKISRKNDDIVTSVYRKFALSDFFIKVKVFFQSTKFDNFHTCYYIGLLT